LSKAIDKLPYEQKEVLVIRYFSELTVPEIAIVTNQREGTIKSRLSRALEHLRKILCEDDDRKVRTKSNE
jgi:RNA polymerase sigma-70 factor (ECF subfamily)